MDELKLLIEMVTGLPNLAIWVLIGYLVYKVAVIGSIYGLARFAIDKLHSWLTSPTRKQVEMAVVLDGVVIPDSIDAMLGQLRRLKQSNLHYIHGDAVDWLRQAIDDKMEKESAK